MGFFDLNIPYTESSKRNSTAEKSTRLKLAVKAMELGYTGVAYNRTITGVMSEVDRCSISLFPLSSVLKLSPSISTSVNLHRRLLNVPTTAPFRQYTRLTVVVDSPAQGSSLNSGNPVLKTYDIVAVRPFKQESFDQACKNYQVDIIAIDFSENRFRLKQQLIKAAIERGVYFEITYSGLLIDAQLRRQMISNTKLLVEWTRGKNIIFSSAAASVTEFRGPYDVANLACLLGLSMERAKASVSKTCRSLLENSLRKKKFYKEAIRVELISSTEEGFDDWLKWDPISSGEGDLQLDDMAKSFAGSNKELKTLKAIDFASVMNDLSSHGLQITNMVAETKLDSKLHDLHEKEHLLKSGNCKILPANENVETLARVEAGGICAMIIGEPETEMDFKLHDPHENDDLSKSANYDIQINKQTYPSNENLETLDRVEADETCAMIIEEPAQQKLLLKVNEDIHEDNVIDEGIHEDNFVDEGIHEDKVIDEDIHEDNVIDEKEFENISSDVPNPENVISFDENSSSKLQFEEANNLSPIASIFPPMTASNEAEILEEHKSDTNDVAFTPVRSCSAFSGVSADENILKEHTSVMVENLSTAPSVALASLRSHDELQNNHCSSAVHEPPEDVSMEVNVEVKGDSHVNHLSAQEPSSERVRRKPRSSGRVISFPFKRLLKPSHFKKALKSKRKSTIL
ncbi:hypothetical protein SSX86_030561 [Deinandra increscens subsp. villosa]|uniref:Uncharacterized protein n=1 Tax=Deinandra increscens subsp. villosa TaxID=3103831 RepID=A0AAP0CBM2_9ASTR